MLAAASDQSTEAMFRYTREVRTHTRALTETAISSDQSTKAMFRYTREVITHDRALTETAMDSHLNYLFVI